MLKVIDVLESKDNSIWSVSPQETAYKALEIMADKNIGALLVIDEGQIVGVFSERDYARKVILKAKSSKETNVGELMSSPVIYINPEKSIEECMALMTTTRHRHMPVIEYGKLIGLISIGDVVNAIITTQKITIQDLTNYITGANTTVNA
ncbi:MAG: CBS domain-containing protein [Nitrospirota bacterium]